jgi:hypothetical protein
MDGDSHRYAGTLLLITAMTCLGTGTTQAQTPPKPGATRMVCWQDNAGNRACGDSVPAQYADRQRTVLDGSGRTIKVVPGALTPAQRAEKDAQARETAALQQAADQQAAYDRALLATYSRPQELAELRDDRLSSLDTRISLAESGLKRDSVSLAELRSRLPAEGSTEKPWPRLLNQIKTYEAAVTDSQRALSDMYKERDGVCANFARDIQRFQELKSGTVAYQSPCPALGTLDQPAAAGPATASSSNTVKVQPKIK